jgi:hypothetical protein
LRQIRKKERIIELKQKLAALNDEYKICHRTSPVLRRRRRSSSASVSDGNGFILKNRYIPKFKQG